MGNATLGLCILINQRQRNNAIGVCRETQDLRGLSAYVQHLQRTNVKSDIVSLAQASYLKAMIEELTRVADRLVDYITGKIEDDKIRRDGLEAMSKLESYITHLGEELEAIL